MRQLYHFAIDPACRKVRIILGEKGLAHELRSEKVWERRQAFLQLNPAGEVPVLLDEDGTSVAGTRVISEYLEEAYGGPSLLGESPIDRAEVRRLEDWFDVKFRREVTANLVDEKILKRLLGQGQPDSGAIRAGLSNIRYHLDYIGWLNERRKWLAGDYLSRADIAAAAQLSAVDYLGDVPWDDHAGAKDWYARIKSRPAFRPILGDSISGIRAPKHYADLDF
ncbi:MAG TPA: glutathione S-transferase family protein [Kiloniellaceae bacterium]|nr:glutathione S-transferase family protein [Kiloniellaceae bacterium]